MMSSANYSDFISNKMAYVERQGIQPNQISNVLFDWQCFLVRKALERGRYALFTDTGTGKTIMQLEWARHISSVIWKDPVTAMQRTKALGLLYKQLKKDSCRSRQGIPDYVVTMLKPGDNPEPVSHTPEEFPLSIWQRIASPIWTDINQSDTLQYRSAREHKDERHICPLQLPVIRRCLELWTNPGDTVLSPFAGIGSEGYESIKAGRKFIGIELKESYYKQAVENLRNALKECMPLFSNVL